MTIVHALAYDMIEEFEWDLRFSFGDGDGHQIVDLRAGGVRVDQIQRQFVCKRSETKKE